MSHINFSDLIFKIDISTSLLSADYITATIRQLNIKYSRSVKHGEYPSYIKDITNIVKKAMYDEAPSSVEFVDVSRKQIKLTVDLSKYTYTGDTFSIILDMDVPPDYYITTYEAYHKDRINNYLLQLQRDKEIKNLTERVALLEKKELLEKSKSPAPIKDLLTF